MNSRYSISLHTISIWLSKHTMFHTKRSFSLCKFALPEVWPNSISNGNSILSIAQVQNLKDILSSFLFLTPPAIHSSAFTFHPEYKHISLLRHTSQLSRKWLQQAPNRCVIHPLPFYINFVNYFLSFSNLFIRFYFKNINYSYVLCLVMLISVKFAGWFLLSVLVFTLCGLCPSMFSYCFACELLI